MSDGSVFSHSYVICAYGESPYLEDCIRSLLAQKRKSRVLMATSTPNEYIERLADKYRIPLHVRQGEKGITRDWNFAYSCAETDYVTLAHQDDVYLANYGAELEEKMTKAKRPLLFFTDYAELREGKVVETNRNLQIKRFLLTLLKNPKNQGKKWIRRRALSLGNCICCPSVTFAVKNLPKEVFYHHFESNEDWEAWERLSRLEGEFVYCPKILMYHRIHEDSETSRIIGESRRTEEDFEMFRRFWPSLLAGMLTKIYRNSEKSNEQKM